MGKRQKEVGYNEDYRYERVQDFVPRLFMNANTHHPMELITESSAKKVVRVPEIVSVDPSYDDLADDEEADNSRTVRTSIG